MKLTCFHTAKWALILLPLLLTFGTKSAIAQITPATDGTGTVVQTQNNQINISGGTQAGQNQFHSFQQFGVNAGQTANFMANPNIANILGRVTGGDASLINGILKVSGSNANLYLMNPAGIVFGKDASLNVPGAFTATTANGIGFGNGNWFNAVGSNNYAVLTANPTSFGFSGLSGSIVNAGNLSVNPGQSIALVGGTVVKTGTIAAPGGDITIAAIPGGKMVRIAQAGTVLSFDLPMSDRVLINAPIATPLSLPALLTGGSIPSAMGVVVEDGVIKLTGGSASVTGTINADGTGIQNGGNAIVYADNHLNFGGTISAKGGELGGNGGFVDTSGKGSIAIAPTAKVLTTAAKGSIGTWLIDPTDLEVVASGGNGTSTVDASTIVTNLNTTSVNLQADNSITVNAAIDASLNANAGNLTLTAPTSSLNQAIVLKAGSTLNGTATTVNVGATGTVQNGVDVSAANGTVNLAAATYTLTQEVGINKNVTVRGAGAGTTTVSGNNAVRVFNISSGTVTLDGMSIVNGRQYAGGGILNRSDTLTLSNSTLSGNSAAYGGGGIFNGGTLTMSNSTLSGNSAPSGGGIYNDSRLTIGNSTLSENSAQYYGGGIFNTFGTLTMSNSTLSGNSAQDGGGIFNNRGTLTMSNSTLSGNSAQDGGGIYSNGGTLTIGNSTLSGNSAQDGGGIYNNGGNDGTLTIGNSIVSGNTAPSGREIQNQSTFTSQGYNLFGYSEDSGLSGATASATDITPIAALSTLLSALGDYGGPTKTHALVPGSDAINAGNPATTTADQRGVSPVGRRDIGAYESKGFGLLASPTSTPQSTTVNTAFAKPLQINVVETAFNRPLPVSGVVIQLTTPSSPSGASATPANTTVTTDANGQVSILATANTKAGTYAVNASSTSLASTADFNLTNLADVASQITTTAGSGQSTVVNTDFAKNLVATVTDKFGNPIANSTVTFTATGTTANGTFTMKTATTGLDGKATIVIKANTKAGAFTTSGSVNGVTSTADFNLTNLADVASQITTTAGSGQSTVVNTDFAKNLVATVTDKFGNPIENTTVTFNVPRTNASGTFATNTANTDVNGKATIAIKANTKAGTFTAIGKVTGIPQGADFALTNDPDPVTINPTNPTDTPIVNKDSKIEDRTRNLDNRNPEKPIVLPSSGKVILCVERSTGSSSGNDPYKGIPSCGSSVTQSKPIVGNTSRNGNLLAPPQAQTDDKRSVIDPR